MQSSEPMAGAGPPQAAWTRTAFDRRVLVLAVAATLAVLVLPIFFMPALVQALYDVRAGAGGGVTEAGAQVGLAVILRAAIRRMFQGSLRTAAQATLSNLGRATIGSIARRELRLLVFTLGAAVRHQPERRPGVAGSWLALAVGAAALALSFRVLLLVPLDDGAARLAVLLPQGGLDAWTVSLLAPIPLLLYAAIAYVATHLCGARLAMSSGADSVLIQLYFAGGGSFLPLATDSHYSGSRRACAASAVLALGLLLLVALGLHLAAARWPYPGLELVAALCAVYAFVYAFPIMPLDGAHLWRASRLLWVLVWGLCLAALIWLVPRNFDAVL